MTRPIRTFGNYDPEVAAVTKTDNFSTDTVLTDWYRPPWVVDTHFVEISSGVMQPDSTNKTAYAVRLQEVYADDQYSEVTVATHDAGAVIGALVRVGPNGGYLATSSRVASQWNLWRLDETGTGTLIDSEASGYSAMSAGDLWRLTATGSTISATLNGTEKLSATDTTLTGGTTGVSFFDADDKTDSQIESWVGSPLDATATEAEEVESNYEICQRSGYRVKPGELMEEWNGTLVRPEDYESRNLQEYVRGTDDAQEGSPRPEQGDSFLSTNEVTADDL